MKIDISILTSILDLKKVFMEEANKEGEPLEEGLQVEQLRFFCLGKELQDDLFLYSYDLQDEITIQCMVRRTA